MLIPEKHYLGLRGDSHAGSSPPLGFLTPYGTDTAAKKRISTVDTWCASSYRWERDEAKKKKQIEESAKAIPAAIKDCEAGNQENTRIVTNELMDGFRISEEIRRVYWGGGNVVWRILDPRGFELEISSSNLARILDCCIVENGVIQGKCIWGRLGKDNILLPEKSDLYKEFAQQTTRVSTKLSLKEVEIGDEVEMHSGAILIYLGGYNFALTSQYDNTGNDFMNNWGKLLFNKTGKGYFFLNEKAKTDKQSQYTYEYVSTPKISRIVTKGKMKMTKEEVQNMLNEHLEMKDHLTKQNTISNKRDISFVSTTKIKESDYCLELCKIDPNSPEYSYKGIFGVKVGSDHVDVAQRQYIAIQSFVTQGMKNTLTSLHRNNILYDWSFTSYRNNYMINGSAGVVCKIDTDEKTVTKLQETMRGYFGGRAKYVEVKVPFETAEWFVLKYKHNGKWYQA